MKVIRRGKLCLMLIVLMSMGIFSASAFGEDHTCNNITFDKEWNPSDTPPTATGNYYLTGDVTLTGTWTTPNGTTRLCLNGHKISSSGSYTISVAQNSTLYIYDCQDSGSIENTGTGNAIYAGKSGSTLVIDVGANTKITSTGSNAVYTYASNVTLTIHNGQFEGKDQALLTGSSTSVTIEGGTFTGNTYGAWIRSSGAIEIKGGTFTGNTEGLFYNSSQTNFISGGTFSSEPNAEWLKNGHAALNGTPHQMETAHHISLMIPLRSLILSPLSSSTPSSGW